MHIPGVTWMGTQKEEKRERKAPTPRENWDCYFCPSCNWEIPGVSQEILSHRKLILASWLKSGCALLCTWKLQTQTEGWPAQPALFWVNLPFIIIHQVVLAAQLWKRTGSSAIFLPSRVWRERSVLYINQSPHDWLWMVFDVSGNVVGELCPKCALLFMTRECVHLRPRLKWKVSNTHLYELSVLSVSAPLGTHLPCAQFSNLAPLESMFVCEIGLKCAFLSAPLLLPPCDSCSAQHCTSPRQMNMEAVPPRPPPFLLLSANSCTSYESWLRSAPWWAQAGSSGFSALPFSLSGSVTYSFCNWQTLHFSLENIVVIVTEKWKQNHEIHVIISCWSFLSWADSSALRVLFP